MLDLFGIPKATTGDIQVFGPNSMANNVGWQTWTKPRGVNMVGIFLVSKGGNGLTGGVGAVSVTAGGQGGGSSGQTIVIIPASFLPDVLFLNLHYASSANAFSRVCIAPDATANTCVAIANGGVNATAGAIATIATMPLAGMGFYQFLAGQGGSAAGTAAAGTAITLPVTGLRVTGGSGGGGLGALSSAGFAGGAITGAGVLPTLAGGVGPAGGANTAGGLGNGLSQPRPGLGYYYGGTGGSSQSLGGAGAAAGGGKGGNAGPGCGGGGGGAGFTGSTAALGGLGGDAQCTIIAW